VQSDSPGPQKHAASRVQESSRPWQKLIDEKTRRLRSDGCDQTVESQRKGLKARVCNAACAMGQPVFFRWASCSGRWPVREDTRVNTSCGGPRSLAGTASSTEKLHKRPGFRCSGLEAEARPFCRGLAWRRCGFTAGCSSDGWLRELQSSEASLGSNRSRYRDIGWR
jgi:hypothetical protein